MIQWVRMFIRQMYPSESAPYYNLEDFWSFGFLSRAAILFWLGLLF